MTLWYVHGGYTNSIIPGQLGWLFISQLMRSRRTSYCVSKSYNTYLHDNVHACQKWTWLSSENLRRVFLATLLHARGEDCMFLRRGYEHCLTIFLPPVHMHKRTAAKKLTNKSHKHKIIATRPVMRITYKYLSLWIPCIHMHVYIPRDNTTVTDSLCTQVHALTFVSIFLSLEAEIQCKYYKMVRIKRI